MQNSRRTGQGTTSQMVLAISRWERCALSQYMKADQRSWRWQLHNKLLDQGQGLDVPNSNDDCSHKKSPRTSSTIFQPYRWRKEGVGKGLVQIPTTYEHLIVCPSTERFKRLVHFYSCLHTTPLVESCTAWISIIFIGDFQLLFGLAKITRTRMYDRLQSRWPSGPQRRCL
jgi:hypothetical protein